MKEYVYSPHYDFFIDKAHRDAGYEMRTFHVHKKYEIYYEVEGTRRYYIDDSAYLINAGNIVLIGPDSVHKTGNVDNCPHTRYVLNFSREYLLPFAQAIPDLDLFACFETGPHVLAVPPRKQSVVDGLLSRIWERHEEDTSSARALRKTQIAELLLHLGEYAEKARREQTAAQGKISNKTVDRIQSYISIHYKEDLTLAEIASHVYLSTSYLSRLFKRTTNLSLVEYINSVRVLAAKNLLETTGLKVTRIADEAGFTTAAHFSRVFKESTGLTPHQYRKYYQSAREGADRLSP